jgi:uncharacterized protein YneF (UPF0154 family)
MPEAPILLAVVQLVTFIGGGFYLAGKFSTTQKQLATIVKDHEQRLRDGGL